jgi:hypothetical protein
MLDSIILTNAIMRTSKTVRRTRQITPQKNDPKKSHAGTIGKL